MAFLSGSPAAQADALVDRRRLLRRVSLWRALAVLAAVALLAALGWRAARPGASAIGPHVARVSLAGFIAPDKRRIELLERLRDDASVRAVILRVDSPGGSAAASETLYEELRKLAAKKPLVAVVETMAASGGYIAALGTDQIVARRNAFVGSVGVIIQYPDASRLLETVGVRVEDVKSGPLKAEPSGYKPTPPEAREALESLVRDSFAWFRSLVGERRGLAGAELDRVSDGRVFTGGQSVPLRLVDQLGGEDEARAWLAERGVATSVPVRDRAPARPRTGWPLVSMFVPAAENLGLGAFARWLAAADEPAPPDGLLTLWRLDGSASFRAGP